MIRNALRPHAQIKFAQAADQRNSTIVAGVSFVSVLIEHDDHRPRPIARNALSGVNPIEQFEHIGAK